jgi:WD40 repeat protein
MTPGDPTGTVPDDPHDPGTAAVLGLSSTRPDPQGSGAPQPAGHRAAVPGYEILRELGRGGMGVVYVARQLQLNRTVALKMILAGGHASANDLERFRTEREAVAQLQHPHIVQIFEAGEHDGLPYFSLEYVEGGTLAARVREKPLPPKDAARLVEQLARGVAYAHGHGIVHRDLKPENVLLADDGIPKIADFGLAKRVEVDPEATSGPAGHRRDGDRTRTGAVVGTPSYMAPEQARGDVRRVGPAADVYALGAILYRVLTGRPPFQAATVMDTLWQVIEQDPVAPSQLQPGLPRDLETIALKCLQKDPARRYASAEELADDLRRYLAGEPILARQPGAWTRAVKWARRRPAVAALLAVSAVLLSVAVIFLALLWRNAEERARTVQDLAAARDELAGALRDIGQAQRGADEQRRAAEQKKAEVVRLGTDLAKLREQAKQASESAEATVYAADLRAASVAWDADDVPRTLTLLEKHRPRPGGRDPRGFEWHYLWHQAHLEQRGWFAEPPANLTGAPFGVDPSPRITRFALSPDGATLAALGRDGAIKLWKVATGEQLKALGDAPADVVAVYWAADGKSLSLLTAKPRDQLGDFLEKLKKDDPELRPNLTLLLELLGETRLDLEGGRQTARATDRGPTGMGMFDLLAAVTNTTFLPFLGADKGIIIPFACAWSPDGKTFAVGGISSSAAMEPGGFQQKSVLELWDSATGKLLAEIDLSHSIVPALAFSPDGQTLATAEARDLILRDSATLKARAVLKGHAAAVSSLAFADGGKRLVSGSMDGVVKVWDVAQGQAVVTIKSDLRFLAAARLAPDGKTLVAASAEGGVKVWHTDKPAGPRIFKQFRRALDALEVRPDGTLTAVDAHGAVALVSLATGEHLERVAGTRLPRQGGRAAAGGGLVATDDGRGAVAVFDSVKGESLKLPEALAKGQGSVTALALSRTGKVLAVGRTTDQGATLTVIDLAAMQPRALPVARKAGPAVLVFDQGGGRLLAAYDKELVAVDLASGAETRLLACPQAPLELVPAPAGDVVACCTHDGVLLVELAGGAVRQTLKADGHIPLAAAFSPDGKRLATAGMQDDLGRGGGVLLWDVATGLEVLMLGEPNQWYTVVAFDKDGTRLIAGKASQQQLWGPTGFNAELVVWEAPAEK